MATKGKIDLKMLRFSAKTEVVATYGLVQQLEFALNSTSMWAASACMKSLFYHTANLATKG